MTLYQPAGQPRPSLDYSDPAAIAESLWGRGAPGLAEALRYMTCPVTLLMTEIVGEPVSVYTYRETDRTAKPAECAFLGCPAGTRVIERQGTMRGGTGRIGFCADVYSLVIPVLLPSDAEQDLKGNVPLGAIVAKIADREPLGAVPYIGGVAAMSRLRLKTDREKCLATANEQFMPWICDLLNKSKPA